MDAPLVYTVRESARARHVRLRVTEAAALEVVVPSGFDRCLLPAMLGSRRAWAERALARMRARLAERGSCEPPATLALPAIGEAWAVAYRVTPATRVTVRAHEGCALTVSGPAGDAARQAALRRWLCAHLREPFDRRTRALGEEHGVAPTVVRVRWQRSRWGSCSARGSVNLSARLGFLAPELVEHVALHELTHLDVFDHSPTFHTLLAERDARAVEHVRALRQEAWRAVPWWLDAPFADGDDPSPASGV